MVWVDEASDVAEDVVQRVVYPMMAGVGNRVLVMMSTMKGASNWYNRLMAKAERPGSKVRSVVFDFLVCSTCRAEGEDACAHAQFLTPWWYDPEKAKEVHALANRNAMQEMQGVEHSDARPAYDEAAVRRMFTERVPVARLAQTIVVGVDPNAGGDSEYAFLAASVVEGRLVILGWGTPEVVDDIESDPNYVFRVFSEFAQQLLHRYGRGARLFVCIESNIAYHSAQLARYVGRQPFADRVVFARDDKASRRKGHFKVGIRKDHHLSVRTQQAWHSWMHKAASVAEEPLVFTGGARQREAEAALVEEELLRQFLEYQRLPCKTGFRFSGKANGNDDLVGGAAPMVMAGIQIVQNDPTRRGYRGLFFKTPPLHASTTSSG